MIRLPLLLSIAIGLACGSVLGQDLTTQLLQQQAIQKLKKPNTGTAMAIPDLPGKNPASHVIDMSAYYVGPGDILAVQLGSLGNYLVDPLGNVSFPDVAPVKVSGLTLDRAIAAMKKALARSYDTSKVYISLAGANNFKVPVYGEVAQPGLKIANSYSRPEEMVAAAGSYTRYAIRNRISLAHLDGTVDTVWVTRLYRDPVSTVSPELRFGDKVVVGKVDFNAPHCVVRNGNEIYFHQLDGESRLGDIWLQVNGYAQMTSPTQARLLRGGESRELDAREISALEPQAGDTIEFRKDSDNIFVGGAVLRPGMYDYTPNFTATDYVFFAGLTPQSAQGGSYKLYRDGKILGAAEVARTGVKPGDRIYLDRSNVDSTRDYLAIIASLATMVISSATLYFTAR